MHLYGCALSVSSKVLFDRGSCLGDIYNLALYLRRYSEAIRTEDWPEIGSGLWLKRLFYLHLVNITAAIVPTIIFP
jgi:hypothetical protein